MSVLISKYHNLMEEIVSSLPFEKPVLFIRGEKSDSLKDEDWPEIKSLFPNAILDTIAGAGHWVHADQPEALKQQLVPFIYI